MYNYFNQNNELINVIKDSLFADKLIRISKLYLKRQIHLEIILK